MPGEHTQDQPNTNGNIDGRGPSAVRNEAQTAESEAAATETVMIMTSTATALKSALESGDEGSSLGGSLMGMTSDVTSTLTLAASAAAPLAGNIAATPANVAPAPDGVPGANIASTAAAAAAAAAATITGQGGNSLDPAASTSISIKPLPSTSSGPAPCPGAASGTPGPFSSGSGPSSLTGSSNSNLNLNNMSGAAAVLPASQAAMVAAVREEFRRLTHQLREDLRSEIRQIVAGATSVEIVAPQFERCISPKGTASSGHNSSDLAAVAAAAAAGVSNQLAAPQPESMGFSKSTRLRAWSPQVAEAHSSTVGGTTASQPQGPPKLQLQLHPPTMVIAGSLHSDTSPVSQAPTYRSRNSQYSQPQTPHDWMNRHRRSYSGMRQYQKSLEMEAARSGAAGLAKELTYTARWLMDKFKTLSRSGIMGSSHNNSSPASGHVQPTRTTGGTLNLAATPAWVSSTSSRPETNAAHSNPASPVASVAARTPKKGGQRLAVDAFGFETASPGRGDNANNNSSHSGAPSPSGLNQGQGQASSSSPKRRVSISSPRTEEAIADASAGAGAGGAGGGNGKKQAAQQSNPLPQAGTTAIDPKTLLTSTTSSYGTGVLKKAPSIESTERGLGITPMKSCDMALSDTVMRRMPTRARMRNIVLHPLFELVIQVAIIVNVVHIGFQIDIMASTLTLETKTRDAVVNTFFCCLFSAEVLMKLYVFRWRFFTMWGCCWNIFDLVIVTLQVLEETLSWAGDMHLASSTVLRISRLLRVVKVLRILRLMQYFEALRLLVSCIIHSLKPFFWAGCMIMMLIYVFAAYVTHMVLVYRIDEQGVLTQQSSDELTEYYGSVTRSVLSLFQGLTGGIDWRDMVQPLLEHHSLMWASGAMLFYLSFAILGLMNVVTGTFVQQAMERAVEVKEMNRINKARKLFKTLDFDASGSITFEEIHQHLDDVAVQEFLENIDVDASEARCLFEVMDMGGTGSIDFEEFLSACLRLQGPARALDLILLTRDCRRFFEQHSFILDQIVQQLPKDPFANLEPCSPKASEIDGASAQPTEPKWCTPHPHSMPPSEALTVSDMGTM